MSVVLVVEDRADIRLSVAMLLEDNGYKVLEADNPQVAQMVLKQHAVDLILLDMNFTLDTTSGDEGLDFLRWLSLSEFSLPVVTMTAWSNVALAVQAMQLGAGDFIEKPWKNKRMLQVVRQQLAMADMQLENKKLKQQLNESREPANHTYQWQSPNMVSLFEQLASVAQTDVAILLTGDNGTGKTDIARFLHQQSLRAAEPFVSVNMGAISENLFESEMFGHKKGAYTDAKAERIGRFQLAEKGSLFLDEVANIPLSQQAKLLRVLESGEYEVLGSSQTKVTQCRVIAATNGNFSKLIGDELFRQDLYYRLNTLEFRLPSLAERVEDILPLSEFLIAQFSQKYNRNEPRLSSSAKAALQHYHWPGNIREMRHLLERAVLLCNKDIIDSEDLHLVVKTSHNNELPMMTLAQAEQQLIEQALKTTKQHMTNAAKLLGLTKSSLYRRLEKYDLDKN